MPTSCLALAAALPEGLSFASLKGYDHYPCLRRLDRAVVDELPLSLVPYDGRSDNAVAADMLTAIAVTYAFACQSPEGDLDALGIRRRYVPRQMLTTTSSECLRGRCPYFPGECLLHGARRRAASADVVVTNHSLLLRDVAAKGGHHSLPCATGSWTRPTDLRLRRAGSGRLRSPARMLGQRSSSSGVPARARFTRP